MPSPPASPTRRGPVRAIESLSVPVILAIAGVAAGLAYALHHLPPLNGHLAVSTLIVMLGAAGVAVLAAEINAERRGRALPTVLVPPPGGVEVRPLGPSELRFCAALHAEALEHGFFVELGPRFMRSYYAAFLDSPHAIALLATMGGEPVGFLVGTTEAPAHASWVVRHRGLSLGLRAVAGMLLHPRAALRFLRTRTRRYAGALRRHRRAEPSTGAEGPTRSAVLSHVAVLPGARGLGAGERLVQRFEAEARRRGGERALLTTLEGSEGAGPFYARMGWRPAGEVRTPDGRRMEEWARDLRGGEA